MRGGDAGQLTIASLDRGVENNRHVHHDVDEQRIVANERAQILSFFLESHRERATGLNEHSVQPLIACQFIPRQISAKKNESEVMHVTVVLAVFQESGIMLSSISPPGV